MNSFADDLTGQGAGKLIIGESADKTVPGSKEDGNAVSRAISEFGKERCFSPFQAA